MSVRRIFIPINRPPFHEDRDVQFEWVKGRPSLRNFQQNAAALLESACKENIALIEVSRAATNIGAELSAFRLLMQVTRDRRLPLEVVYQFAKMWDSEVTDLLTVDLKGTVRASSRAKKSANEKRIEHASMKGFCVRIGDLQQEFDTEPTDCFYNWLYIAALRQYRNQRLVQSLVHLVDSVLAESNCGKVGFSDIFFKSHDKLGKRYNCQARAVAIFVGLYRRDDQLLEAIFPQSHTLEALLRGNEAWESFNKFREIVYYDSKGSRADTSQKPSDTSQCSTASISSENKGTTDKAKPRKRRSKKSSSDEQPPLPGVDV